ncbi:hypothetical protein GE061_004583 [Apolygus lucorum]|uniref:Uncharacterized protein n=1 Tax=Apolygus lucorum TaxID=248454 RepID=A0A8S9X3K5_APOLU|nr:hypothetical protein GE061_004583 [Apolygus lucorum]
MRVIVNNQFFPKYFNTNSNENVGGSTGGAQVHAASTSRHDQPEAPSACPAEVPLSQDLLTSDRILEGSSDVPTYDVEPSFEPICLDIVCCDVSGNEIGDDPQLDPLQIDSLEEISTEHSPVMSDAENEQVCIAFSSDMPKTAEEYLDHDPLTFTTTHEKVPSLDYKQFRESGNETLCESLQIEKPKDIPDSVKRMDTYSHRRKSPSKSLNLLDPIVVPKDITFPVKVSKNPEKEGSKKCRTRHTLRKNSRSESLDMPHPSVVSKDEQPTLVIKISKDPEKEGNIKSKLIRTYKKNTISDSLVLPDPILVPKVEPPSDDIPFESGEKDACNDSELDCTHRKKLKSESHTNDPVAVSEVSEDALSKDPEKGRNQKSKLNRTSRKKSRSESVTIPDLVVVPNDESSSVPSEDPGRDRSTKSNNQPYRKKSRSASLTKPDSVVVHKDETCFLKISKDPGKEESKRSRTTKRIHRKDSGNMPGTIKLLEDAPVSLDNTMVKNSDVEDSQKSKNGRTHRKKSRSDFLETSDHAVHDGRASVDTKQSKGEIKKSKLAHTHRKKTRRESLELPDPIVVLQDIRASIDTKLPKEDSKKFRRHFSHNTLKKNGPKVVPRREPSAVATEAPQDSVKDGSKKTKATHTHKKKIGSDPLSKPNLTVVASDKRVRVEKERNTKSKPTHTHRSKSKRDSNGTTVPQNESACDGVELSEDHKNKKKRSRSVSFSKTNRSTLLTEEPTCVEKVCEDVEKGGSKKSISIRVIKKKIKSDTISFPNSTTLPEDVLPYVDIKTSEVPEKKRSKKSRSTHAHKRKFSCDSHKVSSTTKETRDEPAVAKFKLSKNTDTESRSKKSRSTRSHRRKSSDSLKVSGPTELTRDESTCVELQLSENTEIQNTQKRKTSLSTHTHRRKRLLIVGPKDETGNSDKGKSSEPSQANHESITRTPSLKNNSSSVSSTISDSVLKSSNESLFDSPEIVAGISTTEIVQPSEHSSSNNEVSRFAFNFQSCEDPKKPDRFIRIHSKISGSKLIKQPVRPPSRETLKGDAFETRENPILESTESVCVEIICPGASETEIFRNQDCSQQELESVDMIDCEESKNPGSPSESLSEDKSDTSQAEIIDVIDISDEEPIQNEELDDELMDFMLVDSPSAISKVPQDHAEFSVCTPDIEVIELMDDEILDSVGPHDLPSRQLSSSNSTGESSELRSRDPNNNRHGGSEQKSSAEENQLPTTSIDASRDAEAEGQSQVIAGLPDTPREFTSRILAPSIQQLEDMISLYLMRVSAIIMKCYVPNRAAKMKRSMNDVLMLFSFLYHDIAEEKKVYSTYLDTMGELMAYYIDMEIQASSRAKENPQIIASKLVSSLFTFLDRSYDHILDSILKAHNVNKNFWELCDLMFSGVLKDTPNRIMSEMTYVRYILVYKMWKRVAQGPDERRLIMSLATERLKTPPQFIEKIRGGLLNGIIPKIPKKRCDVTTFLIQAKFDVREKAKAFLKYVYESRNNVLFVPTVPPIKSDIPLLVGYLPDYGPSLNLVKLGVPELVIIDNKKDPEVSGSRIINDLWTSVNHLASFREAIRMQNVTTFNRVDTRAVEKKKIHNVLKHKKATRVLPGETNEPDSTRSVDLPQAGSPDATIVLSDDSDKGHVETVVVPPIRKSKLVRNSRTPALGTQSPQSTPTVRLKQERVSPTRPESAPEVVPPPKEVVLLTEVTLPQAIPKRPVMTPIQIKREIIENDDCIILESPEHSVETEPEPMVEDTEHGVPVELEVSVSLKKADVGQPNPSYSVPIPNEHTEVAAESDKRIEFKEEKVLESPTKEKEINIRRDLFENTKYPDECAKDIDDVPPKSLESLSETDKICVSVDNGKDVSKAPSPGAKSVVFDDEESSWSPSGSQELIRNVVDTFISHYSPVDDVETRLSSNSVAADSSLKTNEIETTMPSILKSELFVQDGRPSAKRSRMSDEMSPNNPEAQVEESSTELKPSGEDEFYDPLSILHLNTASWDQRVFDFQTLLRDVLPNNITTAIPCPMEKDKVTGRPLLRCRCHQCVNNFKALMFNHKALVGFQNDVLKASNESEGGVGTSNPTVASISDQMEPKQEDGSMEQEDAEDESGAIESGTQLPFKKRKALVGSEGGTKDDGASPQYSDTSMEGVPLYYPSNPMMSIALLTSSANSNSSPPPPPDNSPYISLPPRVAEAGETSHMQVVSSVSSTAMSGGYCNPRQSAQPEAGFPYIASTESLNPAPLPGCSSLNPVPSRTEHSVLSAGLETNYTSTYPVGSYSVKPSHDLKSGYDSSTTRPPGGGFPPFSGGIPPQPNYPGNATRLETHDVEPHYQETERPARRGPAARRFVTPAQLKQAFIAKATRSCEVSGCSEASNYCEPSSQSRKHTSPTPEPRSSRAKKEPSTSSRKSGRSSRKKK